MENTHLTPLKADPDAHCAIESGKALVFSTPSSSTSVPGDDGSGVDALSGSFTGMKLNAHKADGGGALKRTADRITVEGSPMVPLTFKQPNLNHTPLSFSSTRTSDDSVGILENEEYSHCIDRLSPVLEDVQPPCPVATVKDVKIPSTSKKVLVICSASSEHNTGDHQENMLRTALLCGDEGCLRRPELSNSIDWINSDTVQPATLTDLLRVHEYAYLSHLANKSKHAADQAAKSSTALDYPPFYAPQGMLDTDTPLLPQSLEAAKRFCGAAMLAVDYAMEDLFHTHTGVVHPTASSTASSTAAAPASASSRDRVFVIGRPPGHHAGPNGCVISKHHWQRPDMTSSGFCLLNTVAVAAAYARYQYGRLALRSEAMAISNPHPSSTSTAGQNHPRPPRIAIVDIDIHHGNGTEDIVRNLSPRQVFLPLPSSWSPVSTLNYKPWLNEQDADEVLFSSIHLYAEERFYPCSGEEREPATAAAAVEAADRNIINICLTPLGPGPWDYKARQKLSNSHREELCAAASKEFRSKVSTMLLPQMKQFAPDLLFISAGFDAHYDDAYHFLTESDVHWVTEQLCAVTNDCSSSGSSRRCKVISVLEGGYSLSSPIPAPPKPAKIHTKATTAAATVTQTVVSPGSQLATSTVEVPCEAPSATAAGASSLGDKNRPVRSKAKKTYTADGVVTAVPGEPAVAVAAEPHSASVRVPPAQVHVVPSTPVEAVSPHSMYAQKPGDGGLVKGVLAHVAALADKKSWK